MLTSKDQLLTSHDEFRKLAQEHMQYSHYDSIHSPKNGISAKTKN